MDGEKTGGNIRLFVANSSGGISMDITQLRYFVAVAEHLNFTEAARHLFIAQSGLSQGIASLEKQLGLRLFDRDTRSVRLTAAGIVFLKEAIEIIAKSEEAVKKAREADAGLSGSLNVGFLATLFKACLSRSVSGFRSRYPKVSLNLSQYTMATLHEALEHGNADIGFTRSFDLKDTPTLSWKAIVSDSISLVVPKNHPLANSATIDFSALRKEPFIMYDQSESPRWFELVMQICASRGFMPKIVNTPRLMETLLMLVDAGLGISIVPNSHKNCGIPGLRFIDIHGDDARIDVSVAWKKATTNPSVPLFLDTLFSPDEALDKRQVAEQ